MNTCKCKIVVYDLVYDLVYNSPGGPSLGNDFGQIKRVALRLLLAVDKLAPPLNSSKGAEVTLCARNKVVL